jgi:predicted ferric reductase
MRIFKQEHYFPVVVGIHLIFWALDLYNYQGTFTEVDSTTMFFGTLKGVSWQNAHRIIGEIFSSWVVTVFAFNLLMASRMSWVERLFGGLDKMYLIHRRSGVIAVTLLLAHFLVVPRDLTNIGIGQPLGMIALILILIGVILSASPYFKRKIPYHKWVNIHKLMGVFYVLGVIHAFSVHSLIQELPIVRIYVFGMAFIGVSAWFYRAFLFGIFNKKLPYEIVKVDQKSESIVEVTLKQLDTRLQYLAGQFAFFTFSKLSSKEQHPFTISSHPYHDQLRITVKNLGDYTSDFSKLEVGDKAFVEGPYGHFSSTYIKEREQVWVAGGIGITPFLSLGYDVYTNNVMLYWCVNDEQEAVYKNELDEIKTNNPKFDYKIWSSKNEGHLTAEKMSLDNYLDKGYLICGPDSLKTNLIKQLKIKGVKEHHIYDEEFAFR